MVYLVGNRALPVGEGPWLVSTCGRLLCIRWNVSPVPGAHVVPVRHWRARDTSPTFTLRNAASARRSIVSSAGIRSGNSQLIVVSLPRVLPTG